MMKVKRRKKSTRYRGSQTHKRGHRKRTKGSGNKGGVGLAGTGKRGKAKKTLVLKLFGNDYFGKDKTLRRGRVAPRLNVINLSDLILNFDSLLKQGIAKQTKSGFEFNLVGYKILAGGGLNAKISVKASAASESAIEQIKAAGGSIELEEADEDESEPALKEKVEEKAPAKKEEPKKEAKIAKK